MKPPSRRLLRQLAFAAYQRVHCVGWDKIGAALGKTPRTCDRWRWKYHSVWKQLTLNAHLMAFAAVAQNAGIVLRQQATEAEDPLVRERAQRTLRKHGRAREPTGA